VDTGGHRVRIKPKSLRFWGEPIITLFCFCLSPVSSVVHVLEF
jgi:hypothetical protein